MDLLLEQRKLCSELPLVQERLFRAGLIKTAQAMSAAIQEIGFETAEKIAKAERDGLTD